MGPRPMGPNMGPRPMGPNMGPRPMGPNPNIGFNTNIDNFQKEPLLMQSQSNPNQYSGYPSMPQPVFLPTTANPQNIGKNFDLFLFG